MSRLDLTLLILEAWIITPGSHTGLYKKVGSAVKNHIESASSTSTNEIVLLGIATWGSVAGKELLENLPVS